MLACHQKSAGFEGHDKMRRPSKPKLSFFLVAAVMAMAAIVLACPLSMIAHAQMTQMMGQDMATQSPDGMCAAPCGIVPSLIALESGNPVIAPLPIHLDPNPTSTIRPIFHPPNLT